MIGVPTAPVDKLMLATEFVYSSVTHAVMPFAVMMMSLGPVPLPIAMGVPGTSDVRPTGMTVPTPGDFPLS